MDQQFVLNNAGVPFLTIFQRMHYRIPTPHHILTQIENRRAIGKMRHLQLARDIRANVRNGHDRISSVLIYRLGPGMRETAFILRRKKELEALAPLSVS